MTRASSSLVALNVALFQWVRPAVNCSSSTADPAGATVAVIFQYSSETNALISFSRSAISRVATDWTRPADSPRETFFQSSGLTW